MMDKLVRKLRRKSQRTLKAEAQDIQDRQAFLRKRKDTLIEERESLREELYGAMEAKDSDKKELLLRRISDVKEDLEEINDEIRINGDLLEAYNKCIRDRREGGASVVGSIFTAIGTGAAIWLGKQSLDKAYEANTDGLLVNKGPLDVFNRLNPTRILSIFSKK